MKTFLLSFFIGALVGAAGVALYLRPAKVAETAEPSARQADGSLIAERKPDAARKPGHTIPQGAKVERDISITVQPTGRPDCPLCTVSLSLVEMQDQTHRIIASSPTGEVVSALDVPRVPSIVYRDKRWFAAVLYNGRFGGLVARDIELVGLDMVLGGAITTERDDRFAPWFVAAMRF
jgi:hypothetical protein